MNLYSVFRPCTPLTIEKTIEAATQLEIKTLVHFIIGMPGETIDDIKRTLNYAMDLYDRFGAWPAVQFATPLPGTRLAVDSDEISDVALPVIDDYGPLFQHHPVTAGDGFGPEELRQLKWLFEALLRESEQGRTVYFQPTHRSNDAVGTPGLDLVSDRDADFEDQCAALTTELLGGGRLVEFSGAEPTLCQHLIPLIGHCR